MLYAEVRLRPKVVIIESCGRPNAETVATDIFTEGFTLTSSGSEREPSYQVEGGVVRVSHEKLLWAGCGQEEPGSIMRGDRKLP